MILDTGLKNRNHHLNVYFVLPVLLILVNMWHAGSHAETLLWDPADEVKVPFGYDYVLQGCEAFLIDAACVTGSVQDVREVRVFSIYIYMNIQFQIFV